MTTVKSDIGRFAMVPEWLLDSGVSSLAIRLFATLAAKYADRDGKAFPSLKQLASDLRVSKDSIGRAGNDLIEAGAIERNTRPNPAKNGELMSSEYVLLYAHPERRGIRTHAGTPASAAGYPHPCGDVAAPMQVGSRTHAAGNQRSLTRPTEPEPSTQSKTPSGGPVAPPIPADTIGEIKYWLQKISATGKANERVAVLVDMVRHHRGDWPIESGLGGRCAVLLRESKDPQRAVARLHRALVSELVAGDPVRYAMKLVEDETRNGVPIDAANSFGSRRDGVYADRDNDQCACGCIRRAHTSGVGACQVRIRDRRCRCQKFTARTVA